MPDAGARTIDLPSLASAEDLLGHNGGTLGLVPRDTLALLLLASGALADRLAELDRATAYASLLRPSWAALAALAPEAIGQQAEVSPADTGSHTDPQSGETVTNAGRYTAFGTGAGQWAWVDGGGLASKLSIAANLGDVPAPGTARNNLGAASQADMATALAAIALRATLDSPAFAGTPTAPTPAPGNNTARIATTAFVKAALDALLDAAPGQLDTLNELAAALGDDPDFAATVTAALAAKAPLNSPALAGDPTAPKPAASSNGLQIAVTSWVKDRLAEAQGKGLSSRELDAAAQAAALGGALFLPVPGFCFQEASVNATTPANKVGDPVGCVRSPDGSLAMVAGDASRRALLTRDRAGNYCLPGDDLAGTGIRPGYVVRRVADGSVWSCTASFEHVLGVMGSGTAFSWSESSTLFNRVSIGGIQYTGNTVSVSGTGGTRALFPDEINRPSSVPHVLRIAKAGLSLRGYYNGCATPGGMPADIGAETDWDHLAAYFFNRATLPTVDGGNFNGGRLYAAIWVPGALTEAQVALFTEVVMARTLPPMTEGEREPVTLDFDAESFSWGGYARDLSDLVDNGDGSFDLTHMTWFGQNLTMILDLTADQDAGSWSGTFLEMLSENAVSLRVAVSAVQPNYRIDLRSFEDRITTGVQRPYLDLRTGRQRVAIVFEAGKLIRVYKQDGLDSHVQLPAVRAIPPRAVRLRPVVPGWTMHRVALYGRALSEAELAQEMAPGAVHVLADSFGIFITPKFHEDFSDYLREIGAQDQVLSTDSAGGRAFYEPEAGYGHAQRFALTPQHWPKTLIVNDGGFEYGRGEVLVKTALMSIVEKLQHGINRKRYVLLEPNPVNPVGDNRREDWQTGVGWLREVTGAHYVETLEAIFCAYSDSSDVVNPDRATDTGGSAYVAGMTVRDYDLACIGLGLWPRTTRSDSTHPVPLSQRIYVRAAHAALVDFGDLPGSTALPGAVVGLAATGSVLTWSPPAEDGGHPVLGYLIDRSNGSGGWISQDPQGSPVVLSDDSPPISIYNKQYIREWTAPSSGTYRVRAVTRKGIGPAAQVTVA